MPQGRPLLPITCVTRGCAIDLAPALVRAFDGGVLRRSRVLIEEVIDYQQFSDRHLLHVTLAAHAIRPPRGYQGRPIGSLPDRSGTISFTPANLPRRGSVSHVEIQGLEIGLDHGFIEDACEQPLLGDWKLALDTTDRKASALGHLFASTLLRQPFDQLTFDLIANALARHVGRRWANSDRRRDDGWLHPAALSRIVERLRATPNLPVNLIDMAQEAGLGVSAFVRAFRGTTGETPSALARRMRVEHAANLLRSTELSTGEIAAQSGFASASHLVRTFGAVKGVTPGRWRRAMAAERTATERRSE